MQKTSLTPRIATFTFIRAIMNTSHRMVYPFLSVFARALGVDLVQISHLLSARALVAAFGPLAASLTDRLGRRVGILTGVGIFSLGAALVIIWPTFPSFACAVILTAFGKYVFDISFISWVGDRVPYERRGRVLAVTEVSWSLSFILGIPLVGFLIARYGWNSPFLLFTLLGVLAFIIILVLIPGDRIHPAPGTQESAPQSPFALLRSPAVPLVLASLSLELFMSAANETINLLFGVWLEDSFGLQIAALGAASAVIGFSELGGEGLVAFFVDRLGKPRAVRLGLMVNSLSALALPFLGRTEVGALVGLFLFYLSFEFTIISYLPLMTELLPAARASVLALNVIGEAFGRALGAFSGSRLYSLGFWAVVAGAVVFNLLALLALVLIKKFHADPRSLEAVQ